MPSLIAKFGKSDTLHAESDGEFATVMEIVGHDAPENPSLLSWDESRKYR